MRISADTLSGFVKAVLATNGVDDAQAESVTDNLIWCDLAGRHNHGVERLPILMKRVQAGQISCPCAATFEHLSPTMARLNGDNGFGHYIGQLAIDRAVDIARETGIGVVGAHASNFYGAGAYYVQRAAKAGMVSLALSNSYPKVAATGGLKAALGTNPFSFGAPRRNGNALMVDMSTGAAAGSTIREHVRKGTPLPEGVAIDKAGAPLTDAAQFGDGTLLPAAGPKGFGLSLMVEILSGVITGAGMAGEIGSMYQDMDRGGDNGHFFLAIDVRRWMSIEAYYERFDALAEMVLASGEPNAVRLPGDDRWRCYADNLENGVALEPSVQKALEQLATQSGIDVPWSSGN